MQIVVLQKKTQNFFSHKRNPLYSSMNKAELSRLTSSYLVIGFSFSFSFSEVCATREREHLLAMREEGRKWRRGGVKGGQQKGRRMDK